MQCETSLHISRQGSVVCVISVYIVVIQVHVVFHRTPEKVQQRQKFCA